MTKQPPRRRSRPVPIPVLPASATAPAPKTKTKTQSSDPVVGVKITASREFLERAAAAGLLTDSQVRVLQRAGELSARPRHIPLDELKIGMAVTIFVQPNKYFPAIVLDVFPNSDRTRWHVDVERTDAATKSRLTKPGDHVFPAGYPDL